VKPSQATQTSRVYEARGRSISVTATEVGGRPVVVYVDVPAGASTAVFDLARIRLEQ